MNVVEWWLRTEAGTVEFENGESEWLGGKPVVEEAFSRENAVDDGERGGGGGSARAFGVRVRFGHN